MSDKKHVHVLSELYAHPIAHNIEWFELIPALSSVGVEHEEAGGNHHFTRNGHTVVFEYASHDTLDEEEIMKLRHFLHVSALPKDEQQHEARDAVVAIDFHAAVVFYNPGAAAEARTELHANLTKGRKIHTHPTHSPYHDERPIIDSEYYTAIIKELESARRIVVLSHGTGSSSAASQLMAKIRELRPELGQRIVAIQRCDLNAMTEPQMVALGKKLLVGPLGA